MGKNRNIFDMSKVDPIRAVSRNVGKHGKLQGNKQEKSALRSICEHHIISKKGKKVKAKLEIHGKNCTCSICKETFPTRFYTDQDYDAAYAPFKAVLSQSKLMAASTNADLKTQQEICELNLRADRHRKIYRNLRKVAQKKDKIEKRQKDKKREKKSSFGAWQVTR